MQALEVSENSDLAVFELAVPVDSTLGEAATIPLTVEVLQGGQMESLALAVNWLDELVITSSSSLDTATLAANTRASTSAPTCRPWGMCRCGWWPRPSSCWPRRWMPWG
jgi:hypothetical protein